MGDKLSRFVAQVRLMSRGWLCLLLHPRMTALAPPPARWCRCAAQSRGLYVWEFVLSFWTGFLFGFPTILSYIIVALSLRYGSALDVSFSDASFGTLSVAASTISQFIGAWVQCMVRVSGTHTATPTRTHTHTLSHHTYTDTHTTRTCASLSPAHTLDELVTRAVGLYRSSPTRESQARCATCRTSCPSSALWSGTPTAWGKWWKL